MASLMPNGKQQYLDSNGDPLVGGKVYTYAAGTSTPKATYTNAAASVENANPIILNARGEAVIFWNGAYKVSVYDANDVLIYTVDYYSTADVATVSPATYGVIGGGVTDDSAAMQLAMRAASDNDALLVLNDGDIYKLSSTVTVPGGLRMRGNATFKSGADTQGVQIEPPRTVSTTVSAIATVQYPAATGVESGSSALTVASIAGFSFGDICHIRSDDTYAVDATANRGELVQISGVSGNTINLAGPLVNTFTTNIVIEKLNDAVVDIDGPTFSYDGDYTSVAVHARFAALSLIGCVEPKVKAKFIKDIGVGCLLVSCWKADVDVTCADLRNADTPVQFIGYGVAAYGATRSGKIRVMASNLRHAYTDGLYPIAGQPIRSGCALDMVIQNGLAINCSFAAWDTHPGGINTKFINCGVIGATTNNDQPSRFNSQAFQDRGLNTKWIDCWSIGVRQPFAFVSSTLNYGQANTPTVIGGSFKRVTTTQTALNSSLTVTSTDAYKIVFKDAEIIGYVPLQNQPGVNTFRFENTRFDGDAVTTGLNFSNNVGGVDFYDCTFREWTLMRLGQSNNFTFIGCKRITSTAAEAITLGVGSTCTVHDLYSDCASYGSSALIKAGAGTDAGVVTLNLGTVYAKGFGANQVLITNGTATVTVNNLQIQQTPSKKGTTANRPTLRAENIGNLYMDTTLDPDGKPIWWNGTAWIDATGAVV